MQSTNDKVLKKWKNILSILLAVLLMNQGIVAEAAPGAQTAISNVKSSSVETTQDTEAQESNLQKPSDTEITNCMSVTEGRLTISWKNVGSDGYELALSKNKDFPEEEQLIYTYGAERSKAALKDLDYDAMYYFRVRTFNGAGEEKIYSQWSEASSYIVNGHAYIWYKQKVPTCTEEGMEYEKCKRCWEETGQTRIIPALGHKYHWVNDGENLSYICERCNEVKETKPVIVMPQSFSLNTGKQTLGVRGTYKIYPKTVVPKNADKSVIYQSKNNKIATVSSSGIITGKKPGKTKIVVTATRNKRLKKIVTIEVKNLKPTKLTLNTRSVKVKYGDKYQLIVKVNPRTMRCPVIFSSDNKKVATIDKHGVIRGKKAGTATIIVRTKYKNKKGKYLYQKCKVKVSHNYKLIKSVKPTCEKDGYKKYKCGCCNKTSTTKYKKLGHKWKTLEETKPTCENTGQKKEECVNCHKVRTTYLKATGHDYATIIEQKKPTCQEKGYTVYECKNCDKVKKVEVPVVDHKYSITVEKKEATEEEDGYLITQCQYCGKTKRQTLTVDRTYTIDLGDGKTTTVVGHYEREMEEEMFNAVNQYRRENNIPELKKGSDKLKTAADIRGYEISYYFEHYRPNGERALISFSHTTHCCGENIARGQKYVEKAMIDFKNSSKHNALMLLEYPQVLSVSVFAKYEGTVNGKKQYSLHYVQFYGRYLYSWQQ